MIKYTHNYAHFKTRNSKSLTTRTISIIVNNTLPYTIKYKLITDDKPAMFTITFTAPITTSSVAA